MLNGKKQVTIYEIAQTLGVAVSTVSRALRDDKRISIGTTERVKNAAAQMGYTPNSAARSLRTGRTNTIGLIVRDINDEWCASMVPAIEKKCAANGMGLLLCNAENTPEKEEFYLRILRQRRVEGIFILTPVYPTQDPYIKYSKLIPLVLLDLYAEDPQINAVCVDHVKGAALAAQYLLDLGHRNIAFISGPLNLSSSHSYIKGYRNAIEAAGLVWKEENLFVGQETYAEDGIKAFNYFWQLDPKPTAIASGSDYMAAGAIRRALNIGVKVPGEVSIIGYDDISLSSLMNPSLTTVIQDREEIAEEAMKLLLSEMNTPDTSKTMTLIPPELIIRESTAALIN